MITIQLTEAQLVQIATVCPEVAAALAAKLAETQAEPACDFYTVAEAATVTGYCKKTIKRRIAAKTIPVIPGCRHLRIPRSFIDRLANPNP